MGSSGMLLGVLFVGGYSRRIYGFAFRQNDFFYEFD